VILLAQKNSYVSLDLMRPNNTLYDLTPSFNGRVGDSQSYAKIWFKSNGLNYDLTDKTVEFDGVDPNGTPFKVDGTAAADQTGDGLATGRVTFYFPAECFQVPGDWDDDSTFFAILDADGNRVSTVNVHLHVLDDKVSMGINAKPFITDFEKLKEQILAECKTIEDGANDALKLITDPNSQLMVTLNAVKTQVEAYQTAVQNNSFATLTDLQAVQAQLRAASGNPAVSDLTAAYPQGGEPRYYTTGKILGVTPDADMFMVVAHVPPTSAGVPAEDAYDITAGSTPAHYARVASSAKDWGAFSQVTFW
jgi:hypothetical protein